MRTFLTRLTFSAAGVVLTGLGMAAAAYASDDDLTIVDESPIYVGEAPSLPPVDECEIEFTIEDCGPSVEVDDGLQTQLPDGTEMIDPGSLDGSESDDTTSETEDSEDGGSDEPADSEHAGGESPSGPTGEPSAEPDTAEDESEAGHGNKSAQSESSGDAGDGDTASDGSGDPASGNAADEPTPESDETTVSPATRSASSDGGGTSDLLFVVLVGALTAFGLGMVGIGLVRRTQPVRNRRR